MNWPPLQLVDNYTLVVSPSQLSLMQRCMRQYGFRYLHRREPARTSISSGAGKAFHSALEPRNRAGGKVTPDVEQEMRDALVKGFEGVTVPEDEYRTLGRYQKVIDAYNAHWRDEQLTTLGVEIPLMVPLGMVKLPVDSPYGVPEAAVVAPRYRVVHVILKAIVDRLVRHNDGHVFVSDTKTTKDWRSSNQVMWERADAPKAYMWGVQELARLDPSLGLPVKVDGFLLDSVVVRREASSLKRPRKEGIEDQTFQRIAYYHDAATLEEWRGNALSWCRSMLRQLGEDGDLQFNSSSCSNWYGSTCPYIDVCREKPEKWPTILSFDTFQDYKASPFESVQESVVSVEEDV